MTSPSTKVDSMRVSVQLFARARDLAQCPQVDIELPSTATVADLRFALGHQYPALAPIAGSLLVAIDHDYVRDTTPIPERAVLACFPPVSGG